MLLPPARLPVAFRWFGAVVLTPLVGVAPLVLRHRYLIARHGHQIVWACRPALLAIAAGLCDERQPISAAALRQLKSFLCDPSVSLLFGEDPTAARIAAQELHSAASPATQSPGSQPPSGAYGPS